MGHGLAGVAVCVILAVSVCSGVQAASAAPAAGAAPAAPAGGGVMASALARIRMPGHAPGPPVARPVPRGS